MTMNLSLVIVAVIIRFCVCQDFIFEEIEHFPGDECRIKGKNANGICRLISDCTSIQTVKPIVICGYEGKNPIVCCPTKDEVIKPPKRVSVIKCEEYKELSKDLPLVTDPLGIIGGIYTKPEEFPHMAIIGWTDSVHINIGIDWKCGGSLISENFVLSAAHCASDRGTSPTVIRLGEHDLKNTADDFDFDLFTIKRIIKHPNYASPIRYNDIALFELDSKATLRKAVRPACLWQKFEIDQPIATATGWGNVEYGGEQSPILQKVDLSLFTNFDCSKSYPTNRRLPNGIIDTQVCYGNSEGGKDTCQGDSGGPIQIKKIYNNAPVYDVVGITSFGPFCGSTTPGVYTRIFPYLDWIESNVWPLYLV